MKSSPLSGTEIRRARGIQSVMFSSMINNLNFRIHHHGYVKLDSRWQGEFPCETRNKLYIIKSGSGTVVWNGIPHRLQPGKAYLFPLKHHLKWWCDGHLEKFYIHFNLEFNSLYDIFELLPVSCRKRTVDTAIFRMIDRFQEPDIKNILKFRNALLDLIIAFLDDGSKIPDKKILCAEKYEPLITYINTHLAFDIRLETLADIMGVGRTYLSSMFHRDIGVSLKHFITMRILERARHLLLTTDRKIQDIANEFHFVDHLYFSKVFHKWTKMYPSESREKYSKK